MFWKIQRCKKHICVWQKADWASWCAHYIRRLSVWMGCRTLPTGLNNAISMRSNKKKIPIPKNGLIDRLILGETAYVNQKCSPTKAYIALLFSNWMLKLIWVDRLSLHSQVFLLCWPFRSVGGHERNRWTDTFQNKCTDTKESYRCTYGPDMKGWWLTDRWM